MVKARPKAKAKAKVKAKVKAKDPWDVPDGGSEEHWRMKIA